MHIFFLTKQGKQTTMSRGTYYMTINEEDETTERDWKYILSSIRQSNTVLCKGVVEKSFISDSLDETDVIVKLYLYDNNKGPSSKTLIGFMMLELQDYNEKRDNYKTLYINILCASVSSRQLKGKELKPGPGSILLKQSENYGRSIGCNKLKLSALPYVINYYGKYDFKHLNSSGKKHKSLENKGFSAFRFKSDTDLEDAFLVAYATMATKELTFTKRDRDNARDHFAAALTKYFTKDNVIFLVHNNKIIALDRDDDTIDERLTELVSKAHYYKPLLKHLMDLRKKGFSVDDEYKPVGLRRAVEKDSDGDYLPAGLSEGFTMIKLLKKGGGKKTKKRNHWDGWSNISPKTRKQRKKMHKRCGDSCFLGDNLSFPVCKKNTCNINDKGLWAAFIRAKQWGNHKKTRKKYVNIANKSRKMLRNRGF